MSNYIKLSDDLVSILIEETKLSSRSVAGQAEHWIRIGRAIEQSSEFDDQYISDVLQAQANLLC